METPGTNNSEMLADPAVWVDKYGDYLFRYAMMRLRDRAASEDVVQETLLSALKARGSFEGRSTERTWLTSILKYKIIDLLRRQGREALPADDPEDIERFFERNDHWNGHWNEKHAPNPWNADPAELLESSEFRTVVAECVMKLPDRAAATFTLSQLDGLSCEEIGGLLGITTNNCWVMIHRARLRLRRCLEMNWFIANGGD